MPMLLAAGIIALLWAMPVQGAVPCTERSEVLGALLSAAYPQATGAVVCTDDGRGVFIPAVLADGMPSHADTKELSQSGLLVSPAPGSVEQEKALSFASTLKDKYPTGAGHRHPPKGFNPGRLRSLPLLQYLYGATAKEVAAHCEPVSFVGTTLPFNKRHGAADALRRVDARLRRHLAEHPEDKVYIVPSAGTFAWRTVKDTGLLSAHAFGIAIDLSVAKGVYWLWKPAPRLVEEARQNYPQAIVDAFEAEGFIWGGKWDAFDFMHFEYRPELLLDTRITPRGTV